MTLPNNFREPEIIPLVTAVGNRKQWGIEAWQKMINYLAGLDAKQFNLAMHILFGSYEREVLLKRAAIIDWLAAGMSYRQIGAELLVSSQTIRSIKRGLKDRNFKSYSERSKTERKKRVYATQVTTSGRDPMMRERKTKYGTVRTRL